MKTSNETVKPYIADPFHGLACLAPDRTSRHWTSYSEAEKRIVRHESHPFNLKVPQPSESPRQQFVFTGGSGNEKINSVVASFLANLRFWIGLFSKMPAIKGLRVITTPFHNRDSSHHFVFFEVRLDYVCIISGQTTDFPEGTRNDMLDLEDVFALISEACKLEIERVTAEIVPLDKLYQC